MSGGRLRSLPPCAGYCRNLDATEFDGSSVGTRTAPASDSIAPRHPSRRQLEAIAFTIRSAPKAALQALPVDVEETKMHLILDTGCQRTVAGIDWLTQARRELLKRFSLKCDILSEGRKFQFWAGGPEMSFKCTAMPVGIAGCNLQLRCSGVTSSVPPLEVEAFSRVSAQRSDCEATWLFLLRSRPILKTANGQTKVRKIASERCVST